MKYRSSVRQPIVCQWPDCHRPIPRGNWGCARHYWTLPEDIRLRIGRAYATGTVTDIDAVHNEAQVWIDGIHERAKDATDPGVPLPAGKEV